MVAPRALVISLVVALVAACGAKLRPVAGGETGVGRITLTGARSIDEDDLIEGLGLTHARELGQPFGRFLVALDRRRVRSYYVRRGFFAVDVSTSVDEHDDRADVTFTIVEGARARLDRVEITGAPPDLDATALRALIPMADGAPFDHDTYELARPALLAALHDRGYARARLDGIVVADAERAAAVIRIDIAPGPVAVFGTIDVSGVPAGLEGAVAARIELEPGARYSPRAIARTRAALYELGRFSLVRVEPDRGRGEVVGVTVSVAEAPRHELRLGGGVGADPIAFEVRGRALYGVAAWPWALTTARTELRPALVYQRDDGSLAPRLDASATLDRLDLIRPRYSGSVEASFSYLSVEAFTSFGPKLRLSARTPSYGKKLQATVGWQLGLVGYRDVSELIDAATEQELRLDRVERLGAFEQSVVLDLRDDKVAPARGGYLELRAEEGTRAAGGAVDYVRIAPEVRGYLGTGQVVLATRVRAGALFGDAPATRRLFAGGANSQRGFPERHLAPFAEGVIDGETEQVPYGGTASLEVSAELRFPLPPWWYLRYFAAAAFLDGGDVTAVNDDLALDRLHWAAGLGLRLPTPIGAARFDVGYRLNRYGAGEPRPGDRFAYHLSVGEAF
jgi:translocation and assembly module TamA